MSAANVRFAVFTKPWKMPLPELGKFVADLGFDGIELPVRPEYQVEPDGIAAGLLEAARILGDRGVKIESVAGPTDERAIAACAGAGVPIIRICVKVAKDETYLEMEDRVRREFDALIPALESSGVAIGVQNHCGRNVPHALGVLRLIEQYDPKHVAAVWDAAHCSLAGEDVDLAADILWDRLCMVNLKNAIYRAKTGPEAETVEWERYWTTGRLGLTDWRKVAKELMSRGYNGPVCLTAEYADKAAASRLIGQDIAYAKSLFE
jgi:sugar phosphate isomerase/epimerase